LSESDEDAEDERQVAIAEPIVGQAVDELLALGFEGPFIAWALISCGFAILGAACCPVCVEEHREALAEAVNELQSERPREGHC
jgi:hypothetical protein